MDELTTEGGEQGEGCMTVGVVLTLAMLVATAILAVVF